MTYSHSGTQPYPSRVNLLVLYHTLKNCQLGNFYKIKTAPAATGTAFRYIPKNALT